ncbi:MAG: hypothetical protein ACLUR5_10945 [Eubacterium ventriosum]
MLMEKNQNHIHWKFLSLVRTYTYLTMQMTKDAISDKVNEILGYQHYDQFGKNRYAFAFKPGDYTETAADAYDVGYYTQCYWFRKNTLRCKIKEYQNASSFS